MKNVKVRMLTFNQVDYIIKIVINNIKNKGGVFMGILGKIYENNGMLCLEDCGKYINGVNIPFGKNPHGGFNIGVIIVGKDNIAISPEAKQLVIDIVRKAKHTGDDISCLDIFKINSDDEVAVSWLGNNNIVIDPNDLDGFFIGCGEGSPDLYLLDELKEMDNETLKNLSLAKEMEEKEEVNEL